MELTRARGVDRVRATRLGTGSLLVALACLLASATAGILAGSVALPPTAVINELLGKLPFVHVTSNLSSLESAIVWQLRLPRVVLAGLVGATLSMSGASYQGVFRNPLADPYLLGVAAGAGLGATLASVYFPSAMFGSLQALPVAAFVGGLVAAVATYAVGRSAGRNRSAAVLVLAGVAVASFLTAVQTFVQQQHSTTLVQVYSWILGSLNTVGWQQVLLILPYVAVSGIVLLSMRRLLDVMSLGDDEVVSLGVDSSRVRLVVVVAATLGTAAAVSVSGLIGFVGIIVPHAVRLAFGSSNRVVLPLSIVYGAAFLILADLAARTLAAPAEIPIGVITAFLGAPFFLAVLWRSRRI